MNQRSNRIYSALTEPPLVAGADPNLVMLNGGLVMLMVVVKFYVLIPLSWLIHQVLKALSRKDPFTRVIYITYQKQADRYEPWVEPTPKRGQRPLGYGRGWPR